MFYYKTNSSRYSLLLKVLNGCYDSLPAVNSDTSLPIKFGSFVSFPNYRFSFFRRTEPTVTKTPQTPFESEISQSIAPYGYEHEECFLKHPPQGYRTGKNQKDFVRDRGSFIESSSHIISISYVPRSNTYIVKSKFSNEHRQVFFKQTNKLLQEYKGQPRWKCYFHINPKFKSLILKHLSITDPKMCRAFEQAPSDMMSSRTILNNPFWKESQALFLLNNQNIKLRKMWQYHYRKKKDVLDRTGLFSGFSEEITSKLKATPGLNISHVTLFREVYDILSSTCPELATYEYINPKDWSWSGTVQLRQLVGTPFDSYLQERRYDSTSITSVINSYRDIERRIRDVSNMSASKPYNKVRADFNSWKEYDEDMRLWMNTISTQGLLDAKPREEVVLKDNTSVIFNPSLKELLAVTPDCNFISDPTSSFSYVLRGSVIYKSVEDFVSDLSFGDILDNAEVLSTKSPSISSILSADEELSYDCMDSSVISLANDLPF